MDLNFLRVVVSLSLLFVVGLSKQNSSLGNVTFGAIFTFGSINGKVAKISMEAAVEDVNSDPRILGGRQLVLSTSDANFNGFQSIIGGLRYMANDIVAVIGPQTSGMAHILSHLANELHVPILSFTALDPSLSSLQYPYFIQTAPNDLYQMTAIADMVSYFGYKEVVVIYTDDDQSRGSMVALGDKLAERLCRITYKAVLSPEELATPQEIRNELVKISLMESRVIVVHAFAAVGGTVFDLAHRLRMMENGYVWIATAWLSTVLDSLPVTRESAKSIQGVLTFRPHTPDSTRKRAFLSRWKKLSNGSIGLNPYGLYAYDTVLMIAKAVGEFLERGGNISFSNDPVLNSWGGILSIGALSTFDGGKQLLANILQTNMTGLAGQIAFQPDKSMIRPAFDILNVIGEGYKQIGYWSNYSGLSTVPLEILYRKAPNRSSASQQLDSVVWPGRMTVKPHGWVLPHNGRPLRIGIPDRVSYKEFVSKDEKTNEIHGYCIDVFLAAAKLLPYALSHEFILFGDRHKNPSYSELVNLITTGVFDAAVGDITIVTNRTKIVDFTQPYTESGLLVVVPVRKQSSNAWAFLRPFTAPMWAVTGVFFVMVAVVVWILEHRINDEFRGPPRKQLITILWFGFSTMFFAHRENTMSTLGRMVLIIWLFAVLIITSSYTASLTSILTMQQLAPSIRGIESLITSNDRIGFQVGSFAEDYLNEELNIAKSRLVPLGSPEEYADALRNRRVTAVVDERPYMELFLSSYCEFQAVGQEFTKSGWGFVSISKFYDAKSVEYSFVTPIVRCGCIYYTSMKNVVFKHLYGLKDFSSKTTTNCSFSTIADTCEIKSFHSLSSLFYWMLVNFALLFQAFPRDSPLALDMSTAIVTLSENGELKKIRDKWLKTLRSQANTAGSDRFQLDSFWGPFIICGTACSLALIIYLCKIIRKFNRYFAHKSEPPTRNNSGSSRIQRFLSFADEKEEDLRRRLKRKHSSAISRGDSEEHGSSSGTKSEILVQRPNGNTYFQHS